MNILMISAICYLLCVHKISFQLRGKIYFWAGFNDNKKEWIWQKVYELISCYFCTGFWIGALYFIAKVVPHSPLSIWILWWHCIRFSLVTAITSLVVCKIGSHE